MPDVGYGSYGGRPLMVPRTLHEELRKAGVEPPGQANAYRCPLGEEAGRARVYMSRGDVEQISGTVLMFGLGFGNQKFPSLYFVKAQRIRVPGTASQDKNSIYLVELADRRWPLSRKLIDLRYNVRLPKSSGYAYIQNTTQDGVGTAWTWQQVIEDLWQRCGIGTFTWPNPTPTLTSTPTNLQYGGVSCWHALNDVCKRIGLTVRYRPIEDLFDLIQVGSGATDPYAQQAFDFKDQGGTGASFGIQVGATDRPRNDWLLADSEVILGTTFVPANVTVSFPNYFGDQSQLLAYGRSYQVRIATNSLGLGAKYQPQSDAFEDVLHDSMPAQYSTTGTNFAILPSRTNPTPTNLSDLTTRATERARDYIRSLVDCADGEIKKAGVWKLAPGPTISEVIWGDFGDAYGMHTTIMREPLSQDVDKFPHHEHVRPFIEVTLTADLAQAMSATATVNNSAPLTETVTIYDDLPIISTNTVYTVAFQGTVSGNWTLTLNGSPISVAWNVAIDDLTTDINNVLGEDSVVVSGGPVSGSSTNPGYTLEFVGAYASITVTVSVSSSGLSGGTVSATAVTKGNTLCSGAKCYATWYEQLLHYVISGWAC